MLYHDFLSNNQKALNKWVHYLPIYENHFKRFVNQSVTFYEIGVWNGGSAQMWKRYLGPFANIIGIDIDANCIFCEEEQINIEIGDQSDTAFLQSIVDKYGAPDIVLDDGSHIQHHVTATFDFLYPHVTKNGVYMVEDLQTAYWDEFGGGLGREGTFIEYCKDMVDTLNAHHIREVSPLPEFTTSTFSMNFYSGLVVFEKRQWQKDGYRAVITPASPESQIHVKNLTENALKKNVKEDDKKTRANNV